ncbi:hypothetical protein PHMEG_00018935 [Phytophthora megakarya]|uniref:Chromo domain-containing protein n=1 Tax=Phytophthora megakarya TaxID=4795 RepID=A0A225VSS9_9STRA|nr:hypothetical protein PHMEG_00018935 [Phytophthora megakarya]
MEQVGPSLDKLRILLHEMHTLVKDRKERQRLYQMAAKKGHPCNFTIGDYVFLMVRWVGPFRIFEIRSHSFVIEHLLTGDHHDVHGTRLKFYEDSSLDVTEEMLDHISLQGILLAGLQDIENSWEPLSSLLHHITKMVREYATAAGDADFDNQFEN